MPKYYGCPCEGCGEPLTLKDDIVVCPDCGAPYHRTCYEKLGRCIHSPAHAAGYEWHFPYQDAELRTCPSCGERTLRSEEICRCCGAALPPETEADEQLNDRKAAQDEQHGGFDYERFYRQYEQQTIDPLHPNLPGMKIPAELQFTKSIEEVCTGKDVLLFAVPSVFVRGTTAKARPYIPDGQILVDVAKGMEPDTLYTMTEVIADELNRDGGPKNCRLVALSGPTHAEEVALDLPTTIVSACPDDEAARFVQDVFSNTCMRVYTNPDIKGVELSGALKNVIALGVGISTGLGYGDNARAALITRGIAEIARLGVAMGCNIHTFAGLAGIGDLIVTATSMHSRNNRAGILIGKGESPEQAVKEVGMVVEGINALPAAMELAAKYNVEMPIVQTVNAIVKEGMSASDALRTLMDRNRKNEMPQGYENI